MKRSMIFILGLLLFNIGIASGSGYSCSPFIVEQANTLLTVDNAFSIEGTGDGFDMDCFMFQGQRYLVAANGGFAGSYLYRFDKSTYPAPFVSIASDVTPFGGSVVKIQEFNGVIYAVFEDLLYIFNEYTEDFDLQLAGADFGFTPSGPSGAEKHNTGMQVVDGPYGERLYYFDETRLFRMNEMTKVFEEVSSPGFAVSANAKSWLEFNGNYYVLETAVSGTFLYRFDTALESFSTIQTLAGITDGESIEFIVSDAGVFCVLTRSGFFSRPVNLYTFDPYTEQLTLSTAADNGFSTSLSSSATGDQVRAMCSIIVGEEVYLVTLNSVLAVFSRALRLWRLDQSYDDPVFIEIIGAFDTPVGGSLAEFRGCQVKCFADDNDLYVVTSNDRTDGTTSDEFSPNYLFHTKLENPDCSVIEINKIVDNSTPLVSDMVTFTVTVMNTGLETATDLQVSDPIPSGLTFISATPSQGSYDDTTGLWNVGMLEVGQSQTLAITVTVQPSVGNTEVVNTASVINTAIKALDPYNTSPMACVSIFPQYRLNLQKTVDNPAPFEEDIILYFIKVTNNDSVSISGIMVEDMLPAGLTFLSIEDITQGTFDPYGTGVWNVGTLAAGQMALLVVKEKVNLGTQGQTITNSASILSADNLDCVYTDLCSSQADLTVRIACSTDNVCVNDLLPVGLIFIDAYSSSGNYNALTGDWLIGTVDSSKPQTLTIVAQAAVGTNGKAFQNCATIKDPYNLDLYSSNNTSCVDVTVRLFTADLVLSKKTSKDFPKPGQTVTFSLSVTNNGPDPTVGTTVSDMLPSEVTFVSSLATNGSYDSLSGIWDLDTVAAGATETLLITVMVNNSVLPGTIITNTATVMDAYYLDPYTQNNSATITMTVSSDLCDLSITKTSSAGTVLEGEKVAFTIEVQNNPVA